jgi:hypothetical protein
MPSPALSWISFLTLCDRAESERDTGGIGRLLDKAPEGLPPRNYKTVIPAVIAADVHQPDEAALPASGNRKCASKPPSIDLLVAILPSTDVSTSHDFR